MAWVKTFPMDFLKTAGVQSCADLRSHKLTWFIAWFIAIVLYSNNRISIFFRFDVNPNSSFLLESFHLEIRNIIWFLSKIILWTVANETFYMWLKVIKYIFWKKTSDLDTFGSGNNTWCETFSTRLNLILDSILNF